MKTQIEQVKGAKRAYLALLNNPTWSDKRGAMYCRFSVMLDAGEGLAAVWPSDSHLAKSAELLPGQVFSQHKSYPAFHFVVDNQDDLRDTLLAINPEIKCYRLGGNGDPTEIR